MSKSDIVMDETLTFDADDVYELQSQPAIGITLQEIIVYYEAVSQQ